MFNTPNFLCVYLRFQVAPEMKIYLLNLAAVSLWLRFPMSRIISISSSLLRYMMCKNIKIYINPMMPNLWDTLYIMNVLWLATTGHTVTII
jgi:hypothetical protein